uniref:SbcC/MukB-like Walker B domain-containing protein n=1 Tax=Gorillibacterium timonense TaxID=1689269 RepID=UPI00071CF457|nr:SbcC/MukB-like Walker B domain-containing protein [Gorillibacterium timonense]
MSPCIAAALEKLAADCRERGFAIRQASFELDALLRRLADACPPEPEEAARGEEPPALASIGANSASPEAADVAVASFLAQQVQAAAEEFAACERELRLLVRDADPLLAAAELDARKRAEHTARQGAAEEAAVAASKRGAEAREQADVLLAAWLGAYGGRTPEVLAAEWTALADKDRAADALRERLRKSEPYLDNLLASINRLQLELESLGQQKVRLETEQASLKRQLEDRLAGLKEKLGGATGTVEEQIAETQERLDRLRKREREGRVLLDQDARALEEANHRATAARQAIESATASLADIRSRWEEALSRTMFADAEEVGSSLLDSFTEDKWRKELQAYREREALLREKRAELEQKRAGRMVAEDEWRLASERLTAAREEDEAALERRARANRDREDVEGKHTHWKALEERKSSTEVQLDRMSKLQAVLRGNAFIDFVAKEQLLQVTRAASDRLSQLTHRRYAIEVDSEGGFIIRDDANGGIKRPVSTLSGGETFLTSLALALALSAQIQLTGESPLEFFFLDEGFGTLDPELLDTVVSALEQLQMERLTVGVISHVPELRARLPKRLIVEPAEPAGAGSRITLETM